MYLLAKFGDHKSYRNGDINSYIKSYMDTLGNAEFTTSIRRIARFLKTGIPIYDSEVPDTAGRKTRKRRRKHAIAKRLPFRANAVTLTKRNISHMSKQISLKMSTNGRTIVESTITNIIIKRNS